MFGKAFVVLSAVLPSRGFGRRLPQILFPGILLPFLFAGHASAATLTVTNLNDNGAGSLRAAITSASPGDTIVFSSGLTGTITLASALPAINANLTIQGPGAGSLTISGNNAVTVFTINSGTVGISGLNIANGNAAHGGGIYNQTGTLTVSQCTFSGNAASSYGGAIFNDGPMTVLNSTFSSNSAFGGGAIENYPSGTLTVSGSLFSNNSAVSYIGGGIANEGGIATVVDSTFANDSANGGGGIANETGTATVLDSTFSSNSGGAIYNTSLPGLPATLTVNNSLFSGNSGLLSGSIENNTATGSSIANANYNVYWQNTGVMDCDNCTSNNNAISNDPKLTSLGNYGGPTQTMLPQPGSAAICAGSAALAKDANGNPLTTDQRGLPLNSSCVDVGAVQTNYLLVNTTNDSNDGSCGSTCSLRDAIAQANSNGAGDIAFQLSTPSTITLSSTLGTLTSTAQVNILGPGADSLIISGNNAVTVLTINSGSMTLSGVTIANGNGVAGGIFNYGTLSVTNSTFSGNSSSAGAGGGIENQGTLTVTSSTFSNNSALYGGGILINVGTATVLNSTFSNNSAYEGGGIDNNAGTATVLNSTFSNNSASGYGGGIYNSGVLSASNSLFYNNSTLNWGAGIENNGGTANASYNVYWQNTIPGGGTSNCNYCTSDNNGVTSDTKLAALGSYGGPTQTILPLPGSAAICASSTALVPASQTTDQRGFRRNNSSYSASTCIDSGAVQTNYQSVQFSGASYSGVVNQAVSPAPVVSVTENGQNIAGVPVTLSFSGTGTATGLGPATTATGAGATFSGLTVDTAGSDTLSATLQITPAYSITTNPNATLDITIATQTITFPTLASPVTYGASPVTLNATASSGLTVSYTVSGPATISGSTLTFTGAGTVVVTASQAGNSSYSAATSVPQTIIVNPATLSITVNSTTRAYGATNPTFTGTPTGFVNGDTAVSTGLNYSSAATAASQPGTYTITASLGNLTAAQNYSLNVTDGTLTVTAAANTITFAQLTPVPYGTPPATLNATSSSGLPVSFTASGPATVSGNLLTITGAGTVVVTATQAGNTDYSAATPVLQTLTVNPGAVSLMLTPSTISAVYGTAITLTAQTTGVAGGASPSGVVTLTLDGTAHPLTLANGTAVYNTGALPTGQHTATASYNGDTNYPPILSGVSTSFTITQGTLNISANNATKIYGTTNPSFTGSVTGQLSGDSFTESFTTAATTASNVGTYAIVPTASGANIASYTVSPTNGTLTITQAASTTTLSASASSVTPNQSLTLTAQVNSTTTATPTGSVQFYNGTTLLGSSSLSGGTASYSATALTPGAALALTAVYQGDTNFTRSTSASAVTVSVAALDFTFDTSGTITQSTKPGTAVSYTFQIAPIYGAYPASVSFAASGLPTLATATFSPASIPSSGGAQTVTVSVQTLTPTISMKERPSSARGMSSLVLALLLLPVAGARRLRRSGQRMGRYIAVLLLAAAALAGSTSLSGCGAGVNDIPANYSITITASSGAIQHNVAVNLDLQ